MADDVVMVEQKAGNPMVGMINSGKFSISRFTEINKIRQEMPHAIQGDVKPNINCMDISCDGESVAAGTEDNTIAVLDVFNHQRKSINNVLKYGVNNIRFLPVKHQAVCSSTKTNNDLRLLSFEKPSQASYLRYFKGHNSFVGSLAVTFDGRNMISAAGIEKRAFLWDINSEKPIAFLNVTREAVNLKMWPDNLFTGSKRPRVIVSPQPVVAFDPSATIFAIAYHGSPDYIRLYDMRNYSKGPFKTVLLDMYDDMLSKYSELKTPESKATVISALGSDFVDLRFSPDGKDILLNTSGPYFYLLDSFSGKIHKRILRKDSRLDTTTHLNGTPEVSFTPDSQFLLGGNGSPLDPRIFVWSRRSGREVAVLNRGAKMEKGPNPNLAMNFVKHCPNHSTIVAAGGQRVSFYQIKKDAASHP